MLVLENLILTNLAEGSTVDMAKTVVHRRLLLLCFAVIGGEPNNSPRFTLRPSA